MARDGTTLETIRDLLLAQAASERPGLRFGRHTWSWSRYVAQAGRRAGAVHALLDPGRPPHIGVLMDNTPEMACQLAAAGLGGHVVVGLNTTRRGAALAADIAKADCQFVLTDAAHIGLLSDRDVSVPVLDVQGERWLQALNTATSAPEPTLSPESLFMLIFTSGTSGDPKAVRVTHEKIVFPGFSLAQRFGITEEDVCYVSMPLFHSNALMAGWGVALAAGACVALGERFSASGFLADVRRYGATYANYVGKPLAYILATPTRRDDAENPLRVVFGNEANDKDIAAFGERFGCRVVDGFGSTENAVVVSRVEGTPPGALGRPGDGVKVLDAEGRECPPAAFDEHGRVTNLEDCTGELVNTTGAGQFAGYYNDEAATAERMRGGMYWSGDLAYRDADGWVYFAGRTADWLRIDGENLATGPIESILLRHPSVSEAVAYAVPDPVSGDQLVAAVVLNGSLDAAGFGRFLANQPDLGTKAWPRHVRVLDELPRTVTNKVLKRELRVDGSPYTWSRSERGRSYGP